MCLAAIGHLELPIGQWPQFLDIMVANSTNENYWHRFAAVSTLGLLSEFTENSPLDQNSVEKILVGSISNIQP